MKTYLVHYGIKGQKWGIRRYQNPDGSLTEEGKRRYYGSVSVNYKNGDFQISKKGNQTKINLPLP